MDLFDVLRHLVTYGPARNPAELGELLEAIDHAQNPEPAPDPAPAVAPAPMAPGPNPAPGPAPVFPADQGVISP
jgi:hypothetical protein